MPYEPATDKAALAAEIALPAYAGMDENQIAAALAAQTIPALVPIPKREARRIMRGSAAGCWGKLKLLARMGASGNAQGDAAIATAITVVDELEDETDPFLHPQVPERRAVLVAALNALVMANTISTDTRDRLMALENGSISRAEQMFGRGTRIESGDVSRAKKI